MYRLGVKRLFIIGLEENESVEFERLRLVIVGTIDVFVSIAKSLLFFQLLCPYSPP